MIEHSNYRSIMDSHLIVETKKKPIGFVDKLANLFSTNRQKGKGSKECKNVENFYLQVGQMKSKKPLQVGNMKSYRPKLYESYDEASGDNGFDVKLSFCLLINF